MSGETIEVYGTPIVLENSGVALANGAVTGLSNGSFDKMSQANGYPDALFALTCQFGTAPIEGALLTLCARPLNVDGSNHNTEIPEATRPTLVIGSFNVNNVTSAQTMALMAIDIPRNAWYYLYNNGTGQSINLGWSLVVTPRSYKPMP